jgi:methanogenic corrinoid protein MtbC1
MMLAVLMRADGWQIAYLGPDTPLSDAVELTHRLDASVLAISVGMAEHLRPLRALDLGGNGIRFVLGGAAASRESAREVGADWVDGDLPAAVERLRANGA